MNITEHSGNKYVRQVHGVLPGEGTVHVDIYAMLKAYRVTCPATQHAIKKLFCAGLRGKADAGQDLQEAIDSIHRAIEMLKEEEQPK